MITTGRAELDGEDRDSPLHIPRIHVDYECGFRDEGVPGTECCVQIRLSRMHRLLVHVVTISRPIMQTDFAWFFLFLSNVLLLRIGNVGYNEPITELRN